jgi:hypothetical protein
MFPGLYCGTWTGEFLIRDCVRFRWRGEPGCLFGISDPGLEHLGAQPFDPAGDDGLLDDYLAFVAARARADTWLAVAYDLKVFFEVVGKEPAAVRRRTCSRSWPRSGRRGGARPWCGWTTGSYPGTPTGNRG